jgi:hypothetical protein
MRTDTIEHISKISLWVDLQFLARRAQIHQYGRRLTFLVTSCEQPVLRPTATGLNARSLPPLSGSRNPDSKGRMSAVQ